VHFVGLFLYSLLKMHGPKNKTVSIMLFGFQFCAVVHLISCSIKTKWCARYGLGNRGVLVRFSSRGV